MIGHLSGIVVGLLYTVGPLKTIMKRCAGLKFKAIQKTVMKFILMYVTVLFT